MNFEEQIKRWVTLDTNIKKVSEEVKVLREKRNEVESHIFAHVEEKQLSNAIVNISDGRLRFVDTKQSAPLTLKYVETCLSKCLENKNHVNKLMQYIKDNREVKTVKDIKRSYN